MTHNFNSGNGAGEIDVLVADAARGDYHALERLYELMRKDVFAFAYGMLGHSDKAEDVVAEVFVRIWQRSSFTPGRAGSGKTFLLKMARNVSLEELRVSGKTDFTDSLSSSYDEPSYSERDITDGLYIDELMKCLSGNECKIIVLYYYSQLTFKEIADVLSLPKSTVKWRHDRALDKLRAAAGM